MSKSKVLFFMTGSIACYKACQVVSRLVQNNCEVQVVATPAALQFVGNATFEGLTGRTVVTDMYAPGNVMDHIHLMRWADLILVAPATANYINKCAQGVGDDLVTTLFLAHDFKKPFLLAPAMNTSMYTHPATQAAMKRLQEMGLQILDSASGILACGEDGYGKLLDPDLILQAALGALKDKWTPSTAPIVEKSKTLGSVKVLITAGGTQEPLDGVRMLTNTSSGKTGVQLAEYLDQMGLSVTLLQAQNSQVRSYLQPQRFSQFADLNQKMKDLLGQEKFTHVIHLAAVSDYSIADIESQSQKILPSEQGKISSDSETLTLHLRRNPKIVAQLKSYSQNKDLKVIAFKLTSHASPADREKAVKKLFSEASVDYVVHNDQSEIKEGHHSFTLHSPGKVVTCEDTARLASELVQIILPKEML